MKRINRPTVRSPLPNLWVKLRVSTQLLAILVFSVSLAPISEVADAEQLTFELNPSISSVDLTAFAYVSVADVIRSTRDTQTIPLGGTIELEVAEVGGIVQSVDFVSLEFSYEATLENPTIHKRISFFDSVSENIPAGTELEVHLPFDDERAHGNPVPRFAPTLTIDEFGGGGTETGAGNELILTDPVFEFEGSGQYFEIPFRYAIPGDPNSGPAPFQDGFPMDYGPYPAANTFPEMMPGTEYDPSLPDNTVLEPSPTNPERLKGTVTIVDGIYVFHGTVFSKGVGGAGILQTAQIHEASFFSSTAPFLPGDFNDDGLVNLADYTVWRDHLGASAGALANDIDGGVVDTRQYETWKKTFGGTLLAPAGQIQTVPEPTTLIIAATVLLLTWFQREAPRLISVTSLVPASTKGPC